MSIAKGIQSVARRVPVRARIAIGQVLLLVAVLLLAVALGLFPNERRAILAGRSKLCEAVAVQSSQYLQNGQLAALRASFEPMLRRDADVRFATICRLDGSLVVQVGENQRSTTGSDITVPIWSGKRKWGSLRVSFRPLSTDGTLGALRSGELRVIAFAAAVCLVLYWLYLRRMLQRLDPSQVVPARVRSALDTLAEGLLVLDGQGRIVLANQSLAALVGKSPDVLIGIDVTHLPWESAANTTPPWQAVIESGKASRGVLMYLRDAESVLRTFSVNCSPVNGEDGISRGVLMSLDDVTQLQKNDAEMRKSKEEADAANRAKSDFLARMSHEIRTPLNAILGFADILRRGYEQSEAERREYVETIHSSGLHLLELINDILDLSKIEAGKLQVETCRCSPQRLISEVVSVMSVRAAQKGITLESAWEGEIPETIETDPTRLRQALTNLVGNAIKFTETGGVRVAARFLQSSGACRLVINVADTGIGMTREVLDRIFDPFAQGDTSITRRFGGTGLGLSISRQIAEALGGGISVISAIGKGSTFTLTVDAGAPPGITGLSSQPVQAAAPKTETAESMVRFDGVRILLADDGAPNRKLISLVLNRVGAIVDSAEDGQAAVEMALRGNYALILMDMQMPVMDGYTATSMLRKRGMKTPIIALTAHAMQGDEAKCVAAGCSGFLSKPIDMNLLLRTVADALGLPGASHSKLAIESSLPTSDPEFRQIVDEFIDRLRGQMDKVSQAWLQGDLEQLSSLAHWIRGSGGTAGFPALTEPARLLEQAAREEWLDEVAAAISQLKELTSKIARPITPPSTSADEGRMSAEKTA